MEISTIPKCECHNGGRYSLALIVWKRTTKVGY
nr:MAG TPA: hypothetical protein [Caudoviricetes sp.]